jgi:uncharacterized protein YqiB (DUF1249 family)
MVIGTVVANTLNPPTSITRDSLRWVLEQQLQERKYVTKVMVDDIVPTEGKPDHACSVSHSSKKCHDIDTNHQYNIFLGTW